MRRIDILVWLCAAAGAAGGGVCIWKGRPLLALACLAAALAVAALLAVLRGQRAAAAGEECARLEREAETREERVADLEELLAATQDETAAARAETEQTRREAQEEAERFRSAVSHGLRIPISIVQGYAELLEGDLVRDEAVRHDYLHKICERTRYMNDVLGRQLSAARAGDAPALVRTRTDVLALVRQVAEELSAAAEHRGIRIQVVSAEDAAWVDADVKELTKAFYNILENAIKYMGRDGLVTITLARGEAGDAVLTFRDDGLGLSAAETEHIFDAGFQGSNRRGGHGHGLYLVRAGIEAHGGTVTARSDIGRGMAVTIRLPDAPAGEEEPCPRAEESAPEEDAAPAEPVCAGAGFGSENTDS